MGERVTLNQSMLLQHLTARSESSATKDRGVGQKRLKRRMLLRLETEMEATGLLTEQSVEKGDVLPVNDGSVTTDPHTAYTA